MAAVIDFVANNITPKIEYIMPQYCISIQKKVCILFTLISLPVDLSIKILGSALFHLFPKNQQTAAEAKNDRTPT